MTDKINCETALDQEIIQKYVRFLLEHNRPDAPEARHEFCLTESIHPKLLYYNPHIRSVSSMFSDRSNVERLMDMTVRDWLLYHHHYVHQAYRYGDKQMQQQWLGYDILKTPFDCWVYQELIYRVQPDYIIELGVMFGGALRFYASICDLIGHGEVIGVDVSLAKVAGMDHPRVSLIEGSSASPQVLEQVRTRVGDGKALVIADSDHEKGHVLRELRLFSQLVTLGSYYVVEDSLNDVMHWHPVPNEGPQAAAEAFLRETDAFVVDRRYSEKYVFSLSPSGFLLRVK
jgi:cephalosporin hydroxylase